MVFSLFKKIFGKNEKNTQSNEQVWIYTQCDKCGEKFRTVIQKSHDLMPTYQDDGPAYILKKELIGKSCPNKINLTIQFDKNYNRLSEEITGGHFISRENYDMD